MGAESGINLVAIDDESVAARMVAAAAWAGEEGLEWRSWARRRGQGGEHLLATIVGELVAREALVETGPGRVAPGPRAWRRPQW